MAFLPGGRYGSAEAFARDLAASLDPLTRVEAGTATGDLHAVPILSTSTSRFDVFVSYASRDALFAADLIAELERRSLLL